MLRTKLALCTRQVVGPRKKQPAAFRFADPRVSLSELCSNGLRQPHSEHSMLAKWLGCRGCRGLCGEPDSSRLSRNASRKSWSSPPSVNSWGSALRALPFLARSERIRDDSRDSSGFWWPRGRITEWPEGGRAPRSVFRHSVRVSAATSAATRATRTGGRGSQPTFCTKVASVLVAVFF